MRLHAIVRLLPCVALLGAAQPPRNYDLQQVGDGVYALVRRDPEAFANNANSLIVVGDRDVIVVDAQFTRAATLETLAAIRGLTRKPVRYVVDTHWHDDHAAGNQVYRDTFPAVEFVAQANTREDLATLGAENRKGQLAAVKPYVARLRRLLAQGLGGDSTPTTARERAALESTIAIAERYAAEAPGFRETLPTLTFRDRLTLERGAQTVEVRWFGRANTRGDAVVWLPRQRVVATGDLVVSPAPFAFNAYVGEWIGALDSVRALGAAVILPGHGPVMRDDAYVRRVRDMLAAVRDQAVAAVARGATLDEARRTIRLDQDRRALAGDEKWLRLLFDNFFLGPAVSRAYEEAAAAAKAPG
ncbi:MAG: MBL fold metallo-hydrolase [Gemmatirosa sp.]|nr:MBL fold metallo-hydrolase [Gemmatirosa sp.]